MAELKVLQQTKLPEACRQILELIDQLLALFPVSVYDKTL
jgi:hypothetical protein